MTAINFYLSDKNASKATSIVVKFNLRINQCSKPYKFSTHESVRPHEWDAKKQKPKTNLVLNKNGLLRIKNKLEAIEGFLTDYLPSTVQNGIFPTTATIKANLHDALNPQPKEEQTFVSIFKMFINDRKGLTKERTIIKYNGLLNHLMLYRLKRHDPSYPIPSKVSRHIIEQSYRNLPLSEKLSIDSIDLKFYDSYKAHMIGLGMLNDSIGKNFSTLKTFMEWASLRGYHKTNWYKHPKFKADKKAKNDNYVLTETQLQDFLIHDFGEDVILNRVKDLFCFMCFTGQRWEDYEKFTPEEVEDDVWVLYISKTKEESPNYIPMFGYLRPAKDILLKYGNDLPKELDGSSFKHHRFNTLIKVAAKSSGLFEDFYKKVRYSGTSAIISDTPQHEIISQYSARRTFCTIMVRKLPLPQVQMMTGHKKLPTLQKYVNEDKYSLVDAIRKTA
jgi:site-specific recombinase XerD